MEICCMQTGTGRKMCWEQIEKKPSTFWCPPGSNSPWSQKETMAFLKEKWERDWNSSMRSAEETGIEKGIRKGKKEFLGPRRGAGLWPPNGGAKSPEGDGPYACPAGGYFCAKRRQKRVKGDRASPLTNPFDALLCWLRI